jgi:hypothetical protein
LSTPRDSGTLASEGLRDRGLFTSLL